MAADVLLITVQNDLLSLSLSLLYLWTYSRSHGPDHSTQVHLCQAEDPPWQCPQKACVSGVDGGLKLYVGLPCQSCPATLLAGVKLS